MARRIAATVLALIAVLLGVVAVPLGLITAAHDSRSFQDEAVNSGTTLASVAEERLSDRVSGPALSRDIGRLRQAGDQVSVFDKAGRWLAGAQVRPALPPAGVRRTADRRQRRP